MRITEEQQKVLDSLRCERLSRNPNNMREIDQFFNSKNDKLVDRLLNEAYSEDENDKIAYYLVKDEDGHILFYFSLKCGQFSLSGDVLVEGEERGFLHEFQSRRGCCVVYVMSLAKRSVLLMKREE